MLPDLTLFQPQMTDLRFPGSEVYDQYYYGVGGKRANYDNYRPESVPHWSLPLALFIGQQQMTPVLDVGCAYGHLVRDLHHFDVPVFGIEWSGYAYARRVHQNIERADARAIPFADKTFGCVVSLDLLEHFIPDDTLKVMDEMVRVAKPQSLMIHVIGAHNPADDISRHLEDPTHKNHEPLAWYLQQFAQRDFLLDEALTEQLQTHPAWCNTDWAGRIVALRRQ